MYHLQKMIYIANTTRQNIWLTGCDTLVAILNYPLDTETCSIPDLSDRLRAYETSTISWTRFNMSRLMTKPTKWHVRPAKTQIRLGINPVWSESSLSARRKLGSLATHWAHSKSSDQTGRMPRLIWVFAGLTLILLVLSCRGSYAYISCIKERIKGKQWSYGDTTNPWTHATSADFGPHVSHVSVRRCLKSIF